MEPKPVSQKLITAAATAALVIQIIAGVMLAIHWN